MKPEPFEALNHFTVPCSFTATTPRVGIALLLLVALPGTVKGTAPRLPKIVTSLVPIQKTPQSIRLAAFVIGPKGNTRATNADCDSTIKGVGCRADVDTRPTE